MSNAADPGFGIYVHWPFCAAKCPYCDFNSHVRHQAIDETRYLAAFKAELRHYAALAPKRRVDSIFFGGGTPSLMAPGIVGGILDEIAALWPVDAGTEITLEANPSSADADRFAGYRSAGVNRLSLGVQAFNDVDLKALGRLHDVAEAEAAIALARSTFPRLSFDLIYARPDQGLADWSAELDRAIDRAADHLSLYQLTIEPDTPFAALHAAGKLTVPDADRAADFYTLTQEICEARGLPAYEISNHAAPGSECRHNLVYWHYGAYLGVGPGAHGRLDIDGRRHALAQEKRPEHWLALVEDKGHGTVIDDPLSREEAGDEFLVMGLRLAEGIDLSRYETLSGRSLDPDRLHDLAEHGMVKRMGRDRVRVTAAGWPVLNAVVADLAA